MVCQPRQRLVVVVAPCRWTTTVLVVLVVVVVVFVCLPQCCAALAVHVAATNNHKRAAQQQLPSSHPPPPITTIVPPDHSFPTTTPGEQVSIASLNILAPAYHFLGRNENDDATDEEQYDRLHRVPLAIAQAKRTNADILLLQEAEGREHEPLLERCLREPMKDTSGTTTTTRMMIPGYDSYVWSALYPNRVDDVVGCAVAWRSDRFQLVSQESFRRGMIVQLQDRQGNHLVVANLHLFAKPSAIEQRLRTMASTMRRIQALERIPNTSSSSSPLDGLVVLGGDLNCDHPSVTTRLATTGYSPYGRLQDRNFTTRITKATAAGMRHPYRFRHVYEGHAATAAPVTVSLHGRGPGVMDHLLYVSGRDRAKQQQTSPAPAPRAGTRNVPLATTPGSSKRKTRRLRAVARERSRLQAGRSIGTETTKRERQPLCVQALLATVDAERLPIVNAGLPNVAEGYPSDHLPIGAIFGPDPTYEEAAPVTAESLATPEDLDLIPEPATTEEPSLSNKKHHSNLSSRAFQRRNASTRSTLVQQRHNAVLRTVAAWLVDHGATDLLRDRPLYEWPWLADTSFRNKRRAPDLCCIVGNETLVMVEIAVRAGVDKVRKEKRRKYQDVVSLLQTAVRAQNLTVAPLCVVALDPFSGRRVPESTRRDLERLAAVVTSDPDQRAKAAASLLESLNALELQPS